MGTMLSYIQNEPDLRQRFVSYAYKENPRIKDLRQFTEALISAFDTERGQRASKFFDEQEIRELFLSDENREAIRNNLSEKEYDYIFEVTERSDSEILRTKPVGEPIKSRDVRVWYSSKEVKVKSYNKQGKPIKNYSRGFQKWSPAQERFLKVRKQKKISPKQIIEEYNKQFKAEKRSKSSISTKIYRI